MENPMQFTMVREVPFISSRAFCATNVENKGESAMTTIPQKKRNVMSTGAEGLNRKMGENRQHRQDRNNDIMAILFVPKCSESKPLITQAIPPVAITRKEKNEMSKLF